MKKFEPRSGPRDLAPMANCFKGAIKYEKNMYFFMEISKLLKYIYFLLLPQPLKMIGNT